MSLFSVSRLIGKTRTRSSKRTSSVKGTAQENVGSQSQKGVLVDSAPSTVIAVTSPEDETSKANSRPEIIPNESFPPASSHKSEVSKTHERKTGIVEEPGYDVVLQPSAKASFGDWTELDIGKKASGPAANASDAERAQFGIDQNTKEESLPKTSNNSTPLDTGEEVEEHSRKPSVPEWTHLDIDKQAEEPSTKPPSEAEWLQLDIDKKTKEEKDVTVEDNGTVISEARVNEERAAHLEEMRIVKEEKEKLAGRVKELEEALYQAEHELQLKMEQINKLVIDFHRKEEEIEALKEENERVQEVAAREKEVSLEEIRRSNEAMAARPQAAKELKDVEVVELLAKQDDMQDELDTTIGDLSESRARVAELESTNELQAKKLSEQDATLASHTDVIAILKGQKANLIVQVHTLRANVKVNQRQNSMLMAQLKQQSDDLVAGKLGNTPIITKSGQGTTRQTLVEQAVRTIKGLNDEIYQTAASLTDCVDEIEKRFVDESDGTAAALETLKSLLGTEIYKELNKERYMMKEEYNAFILQTGFQACLTACCMRIITSWYPAVPEYGKFLEAVYERIRGLGELSFFRPWINLAT